MPELSDCRGAIADGAFRQPRLGSYDQLWETQTTDKERRQNFLTHQKATSMAESFCQSTPFEDDLQKLSSPLSKLGRFGETFFRPTQFGDDIRKFPPN